MSNNENAPEVTAPERLWLEVTQNWFDCRFTFTKSAREWSECKPDTPGRLQYVLASKADAQADELRAEVDNLKVRLGWAESREQNAVCRAAKREAEVERLNWRLRNEPSA